jgi:DtxR family Mn-dependent transcriptional regulator
MPSSTVENYLKQIYLMEQSAGDALISMGEIASAMGVVPGTATSMIKTLADSGLVEYAPRGGVRLTTGGRKLALHVLRRHRLVELFLVQVLGLDWSEVHAEAEELEHTISDKVLDRIDAFLGHPSVDPHGDPIPSAKGHVSAASTTSLADCATATSLRVSRVLDQDPAFLQFASRSGLRPGATVTVQSREAMAGAVSVKPEGAKPVTLGTAAAEKILVEPH